VAAHTSGRGWLAGRVARLEPADVACWVLKSSLSPDAVAPGWLPGAIRQLDRCLRRSYRLTLMRPGQPCLLWVSGRHRPGVHALGELAAAPVEDDGGPVVAVRLTRLAEPVDRADLLAEPATRDAEVLRMPAGSNPSWLSPAQYAAVLAHAGADLPPTPCRVLSRGWDHGSS
jgi:hypothetical protein